MAKSKTPKISGFSKQKNIALTYTFLKDGKSIEWIEDYFIKTQGTTRVVVGVYLREAKKLIATDEDMDIDYGAALHDARYEKIWKDDKDAYLEWVPNPEETWERMINYEIMRRYKSLLKSLLQREKLYGLRDKDLILAMNNDITLIKNNQAVNFLDEVSKLFDMNRLTHDEQVELLKLLEESYDGDLFKEEGYLAADDDEVEEVAESKIDRLRSKEVVKESFDGIRDVKKRIKNKVSRPTGSIKVIDVRPEDAVVHNDDEVMKELKKSMIKKIREKYKKK